MLNPEMHLDMNGKPGSTRDGLGKALLELGEKDPNMWVLTADVAESTRVHWFAEKFPKRFVQVGIAEQNMASVASGIASTGKTALISAFGAFNPGRNFDQIRVSICYNDAKVIVHASHTGITVGPDGASHQILEDLALMRALPNMVVLVPADTEEAKKALIAAHAQKSPAYIRTGREKLTVFTTDKTPFEIGKANVLRDGNDVAIFACGVEVYQSLKAAEMLEKEGISAAVVNVHTLKPIDRETIVKYSKKCGLAVSVEEHQINGGLGSAVAEVVAEDGCTPLKRHGIYDTFAESGEAVELMRKYKLDAQGICETVKEAISYYKAKK
ncbi:1-deoxy-D-xylulose-5-phosphate synthase [uncultured archaeon]|nr:1-deoxy-D-xylulose-5-phosphate synthase [uncultured archaeon]